MAFASVNVHNKKAVAGTIAREVLHFVHNELAQCCQTAFLELPCLLPLCCVVLKLFSTADEAATPSMTPPPFRDPKPSILSRGALMFNPVE